MGSILQPGFLFWDGIKYVTDPLTALEGPPGPPGETGPQGPPGSGGVGIGNALFVSKLGNDTTGDGSFDNPYLTVLHANTVLKNKTLPPNSQLWTILIGNGTYNENIPILPNASYLGFDVSAGSTIISGNHTLDASWTGYGVSQSFFGALTFSAGSITANFAAVSNDSQLSFFACQLPINVSTTGIGSGNTNLSFELCKNVSGEVSITNGKIQSQQTNFSNTLTIAGATGIASWVSSGSDVVADLILNGNTGFATSAIINGGSSVEALTLNGVLATYNSPIGSIPTNITFTNTATASQITIVGELPVINIVPATTDGYVITTLGGQAIWAPSTGGGGGIGVGLNVIYVSPTGNDSTGLGTLASPFATYAHSIGVIGSSATNSNFWSVQFGPGSYNENILLVPWITITGFDAVGSTILNGTIGLASSFVGSTRKLSGISNTTINGSVDFNFAGVGSTGGQIQLTQCFVRGSFTSEGNGTVNNTLTLTECVASNLTVTDINLTTQGTTINGSFNLAAPSFGVAWNSFESTTLNCFVDGSAGRNANVNLAGSMVNGLLQLKGGLATYTSTISGIPASVSLISGAVAGQYNINGNLPVGNIGANGITDGYVITSRSGHSVWAPSIAGTSTGPWGGIVFVVSNNGNDTTGDGSLNNPYATIAKVNTVLTPLIQEPPFDLALTLPTVLFLTGTWTENFTLLPFVSYLGFDTSVNCFFEGNCTLDALWTGAEFTEAYSNITNMYFIGNTNFDFSLVNNGSINAVNCQFGGNITQVTAVDSFTSGQANLFATLCTFHSSAFVNVTSGKVFAEQCAFHAYTTITATGPTNRGTFESLGGNTHGGGIILNGVLGAVTCALGANETVDQLTINGTLATISSLIGSTPGNIILTNGASLSQSTVLGHLPIDNLAPSGTNGWVATTVGGHATWAAPSGGGGGGPANVVFVATNGDDTAGNGSFTAPFATYGKAVSAIGSGAATTTWLVIFAPGSYTENILLASNIDLTSWDPDFSAGTSGSIGFGPSFTGNCFVSVSNFSVSGAASFAFTSGNQELDLINVEVGNIAASGVGLSGIINIENCNTGNITISDCTCEIYSSFTEVVTVNAPSFGSNIKIRNGSAVNNVILNGTTHSIDVANYGSVLFGNMTFNGTFCQYTGPIGGVPAQGVIYTGGATSSQYIIFGELPPANIAPFNPDGYVHDGYVLTVASGISTWLPPLGGSSSGLGGITYVGKNGSDIGGNGSFNAPYLTIGKANAVVKSGGLNLGDQSWEVQIGPGVYVENIVILPGVAYCGFDFGSASTFIQGNFSLDTSWNGFGDIPALFTGMEIFGNLDANFLGVNNDSLLEFTNCGIFGNVTIEGFGSGNPNVLGSTLIIYGTVTVTNAQLATFACGLGNPVDLLEAGIVINATTGPASWISSGDTLVGGITFNGVSHAATATVSAGTSVDTLTLNGTHATYTGYISNIPSNIIRTGGAQASQIVILGELPPANIFPSTTDGYVITTVSGQSTWAPPSGGGGGGSVTLIGDTIGGPGTTIATTTQLINHASVPVAGALTTGNVLRVSGSSALTYSAVNLAGGSGWVTGNLPITNIASGTNGQILTTSGGVVVWSAPGAGGGISNVLYVAKNGSDTIGNGTFQSPFATYGKCVTTIGGLATSTNLYSVLFGPGQYSEVISLAPWITIVGFDANNSTVLTGSIGLSAAWTGSTTFISGISTATLNGGVSIGFNTGPANNGVVEFNNIIANASFSINGTNSALGTNNVIINNSIFNSGMICGNSFLVTLNCCFSSATFSAINYATVWNSRSDTISGTITLTGALSAQLVSNGSTINTLILSGTHVSFISNIGGIPETINFTSGATISQITISGELPPLNVSPTGGTTNNVLTWSASGGVWAAPTGGGGSSNGIGQLTTDVTTPAASAPDQTLAATVVQAQNGKIVFGPSGLTTWANGATFGLTQASTTGAVGAIALWEPQQSTNSGNGTGGLALISLQTPLGSGSESQLWVARGIESNPRFAAGTFNGLSTRGVAWVTNGSNAIGLGNYFVSGDGVSFNYFNGPGNVSIVINGANFAQVNTIAGTQFGATSSGFTNFGGGQGVIGLSHASLLPNTAPTDGVVMAVNSATTTFNLYSPVLGSIPFVSMGGNASFGLGNVGILWANTTTPNANNYMLASTGATTYLNGTSAVNTVINGTGIVMTATSTFVFVPFNVNFGVATANFGGGEGCFAIGPAPTLPTGTLSTGITMAATINALNFYGTNLGTTPFMSIGGSAGNLGNVGVIWMGQAASNTTNFALAGNSGITYLNGPGTLELMINGVSQLILQSGLVEVIPGNNFFVGGAISGAIGTGIIGISQNVIPSGVPNQGVVLSYGPCGGGSAPAGVSGFNTFTAGTFFTSEMLAPTWTGAQSSQSGIIFKQAGVITTSGTGGLRTQLAVTIPLAAGKTAGVLVKAVGRTTGGSSFPGCYIIETAQIENFLGAVGIPDTQVISNIGNPTGGMLTCQLSFTAGSNSVAVNVVGPTSGNTVAWSVYCEVFMS